MEREQCSKKRREWRYFSDAERNKLEGLVDDYRRTHGKLRKWRLPTCAWASVLGRDPSSVRRELARGKMRMGSEDSFVHWRYSAQLSAEKAVKASANKGRECDLVRRTDAAFTSVLSGIWRPSW